MQAVHTQHHVCNDLIGFPQTNMSTARCLTSYLDAAATAVQHDDSEYGAEMKADGQHYGGPFTIHVSPKMRVEELRTVIRVSLMIMTAARALDTSHRFHTPAVVERLLIG